MEPERDNGNEEQTKPQYGGGRIHPTSLSIKHPQMFLKAQASVCCSCRMEGLWMQHERRCQGEGNMWSSDLIRKVGGYGMGIPWSLSSSFSTNQCISLLGVEDIPLGPRGLPFSLLHRPVNHSPSVPLIRITFSLILFYFMRVTLISPMRL